MESLQQVDRIVEGNTKKAGHWLPMLLAGLSTMITVVISPYMAHAETANMTGILAGSGQVCINYVTGYASLADWSGGTPAELNRYAYISYDSVKYFETVHSCVGGTPLYPGPLPEGSFFLLMGGLTRQAAIVNIERIEDDCPYILTYYWLTNPVSIPDPSGTCVKGNAPDIKKNQGSPDSCQ